MKIGAAQWDITPEPGVELCGFLGREQPSIGIQDSLKARALYFEQGAGRLLWIHADLLGWGGEYTDRFRAWAKNELGLKPSEVLLSATHTHGAPGVLHLLGCGRLETEYAAKFLSRIEDLAVEAKGSLRPCRMASACGALDLAVDRRKQPTALTDPRLTTIGWRALDGPFIAVAAVYSMHPVAMGPSRLITADWPGRASITLQNILPGNPVAVVSSGASGNLNTPQCGATVVDMQKWGDQIGEAAAALLTGAEAPLETPEFRVACRKTLLPLDAWDEAEINHWITEQLQRVTGNRPLDNRYRNVMETWRQNRLRELNSKDRSFVEAELFAIRFGSVVLMGVNAEVFCQFTRRVCEQTGRDVAVMGCCNSLFGYLPHAEAYDEGGYEPNSSFLFYDHFRLRRGGLELLSDQAQELVAALFNPDFAIG